MTAEINPLKHCPHKHTRPRLVAWTTDVKGKYEQGFKTENCCIACGAVVPSDNKVENLIWVGD